MDIFIELTTEPILRAVAWPVGTEIGSLVEFYGLVRQKEDGKEIRALDYEAYEGDGKKNHARKITELEKKYPRPCGAGGASHRPRAGG